MLPIAPGVVTAETVKPFVVPELREWKAAAKDATFTPGEATEIVCRTEALLPEGERLAADYEQLTGRHLTVKVAKSASKGDIFLEIKPNKRGKAEGYRISVTPSGVTLTGNDAEGLRWATRTLLQLTEASPALPCGTATDWPDYNFRGFVLDCGRKYIPIDYLYKLVDVLSYYKMNVLHIHLNDNGFKAFYEDDWDKTQAAFRMESDRFPGLTARDGNYTKQEFRDLQAYALSKGVEIVPEIDIPAHSLAFSRFRPEIGSSDDEYGRDHLDLTKEATYQFLDSLIEEYIAGPDPVFTGKRFHIGTDEYSNRDSAIVEKFRALTDRYINLARKHGKRPMVWGALTHAKGSQPVSSDGVEMYCWYNGYAAPDSMLSLGYDIVSVPDGWTYIVPAAGYYNDFLNNKLIYEKWSPAQIGSLRVDPTNPQLLGGMFAVWNDHPNNGITVRDIHHRIMEGLPAMAAKTWDGDNVTLPFEQFDSLRHTLSEAPGVNYRSLRRGDAAGTVYSAPVVKPGSTLPIDDIGYGYTVEFDLDAADELPGTALFSTPEATFWLSDPISGQMGFSREGELRTFRYAPRAGEKARICIEGTDDATRLYVNDKLIDDLRRSWVSINGNKSKMARVSTLVFPLRQAGEFKGNVSNLRVSVNRF